MTKRQIRALVESQNLNSSVFEGEPNADMVDVYYDEFEKLPEWLQKAISDNNITIEETEASIWQHMSQQENFEAFNSVLRGQ